MLSSFADLFSGVLSYMNPLRVVGYSEKRLKDIIRTSNEPECYYVRDGSVVMCNVCNREMCRKNGVKRAEDLNQHSRTSGHEERRSRHQDEAGALGIREGQMSIRDSFSRGSNVTSFPFLMPHSQVVFCFPQVRV
jgi:hypothetical protein